MKKNPPIKIEYHSGKAPKAKKEIKPSKKLKVITDPEGQKKHPGKITKIPSGNITMKDIPYPVLGIDNLGNQILMMPDQDYSFPGDEVTEYPIMQKGGVKPIIVTDPNDPRLQAYNDSLKLYTDHEKEYLNNKIEQLKNFTKYNELAEKHLSNSEKVNLTSYQLTQGRPKYKKEYKERYYKPQEVPKNKYEASARFPLEGDWVNDLISLDKYESRRSNKPIGYSATGDPFYEDVFGLSREQALKALNDKSGLVGDDIKKYIKKELGDHPDHAWINLNTIIGERANITNRELPYADINTVTARFKKPVQPVEYQKPEEIIDTTKGKLKGKVVLDDGKNGAMYNAKIVNKKPIEPKITKAQANIRYEQPPIFEITMPTGDKISKKDFIKQYGEAAWNRATGKFQDGGSFNLSKPSLKGIKDNIDNMVIPYGINPYTSKPFATGAIEESMSPLDLIGGVKGLIISGKGIIDLTKAMKSNPVNIGNTTFELGKHPKAIERAMKKINSGVIEVVKPNFFQDGGQNSAAYPTPKKFVAEFNKQQAAAEEYTKKSTGKTLKERQSARGINPYTSKPFATGEAEYFPIESVILPGTPVVKGIGKVANLALDAMNPMAGMRSPGQYYDDATGQAINRAYMSKRSMENKLDQIAKFYEDPRNEDKFFYTDKMAATDEALNRAKYQDREMTFEEMQNLANNSPEAFVPYYNERLGKYYSGSYGEDAVPIFEGRFNQRQPDSNIQGDYFDLKRTGYTDLPSFNQQVNDLKIRGVHGDLTKKHKLGKSATKDLAEQRAMDPDGGIELYNQGRLLDDSMDPNKLKKFRAIDAYQGLQPNKLGGQFDYKGPIANFLKKGGQPTYAEFLNYGHPTGPMMFEDGGSTSCDNKFEQGKSTTDNIIGTKREALLKFIRKNTMSAIDKEVRTDIAQMGVDHWNSFQPQSPQFNANQMFGVNPIAMDLNQMSQKFVTSPPEPTNYRRTGNNFGEPGVNAVLTGINAVTMGLENRQTKINERNNSYRTTPDYFSPVVAPFLGDWETNKEVLRPNKMVGAQYQGFKEGGEVYLTQQEIDDLLRNGGQIEYLD